MIYKQLILGFVILLLLTSNAWSQRKLVAWDDFKEPRGEWFETGDVKLNPADNKRLSWLDGEGVLINGEKGRILNLS